MPPSGALGRFSPEFRSSLFYFVSMSSGGAQVTFLSIWLAEKGITPAETGLVNALPLFLIVVMNLFLGRLADRASDWKQVILICAVISGLASLGLFFAHDFWSILIIWSALGVPAGAAAPVLDAALVRMTHRNGSDYGVIRAWGTLGYMVMNVLTGLLVIWLGSSIFVPLFVLLTVARAAFAFWLPRFRAPEQQTTIARVQPAKGQLKAAMKLWFVLPLVGFCVIYGSHWMISGFGALLWKQQGIAESIIGPLIAVGSLSEALVMFVWKRFGARVSARHLMIASACFAATRWFAMGFAPSVPLLLFLQMLHGMTFALGFLGCVHFIANWTSEDIAAEVQSLFSMGQQLMAVFTVTVFGALVAIMGVHAYWMASALAVLGGGMVALSLTMQGVKR